MSLQVWAKLLLRIPEQRVLNPWVSLQCSEVDQIFFHCRHCIPVLGIVAIPDWQTKVLHNTYVVPNHRYTRISEQSNITHALRWNIYCVIMPMCDVLLRCFRKCCYGRADTRLHTLISYLLLIIRNAELIIQVLGNNWPYICHFLCIFSVKTKPTKHIKPPHM